ncbi:MAG: AMP-binding protein [Syntrophaceae bacterium]|nr:AMP-binding protein [Syntrophaceae bacterium]
MKEDDKLSQNRLHRQAVGDFLKRTAKRSPERIAFMFRDRVFTYARMDAAANRVCHGLQDMGLKKGDCLAILSQNCHQMAILMWACFKSGIWYAPVNFLLRGPEIVYQVNHCDAKAFFVESGLLDAVRPIMGELKTVEKYGLINLAGIALPEGWIDVDTLFSEQYPDTEPDVLIDGKDVASIIYTSGTTAAPKGALLSNGSYFSQAASFLTSAGPWIEAHDKIMMNIPLFHVGASSISVAFAKIGAGVVYTYGIDPVECLEIIQKEKITSLIWPPTLFAALLSFPVEKYDLSSLKKCVWFGGAMPLDVLRKWMDLCPGATFAVHWSQTEINITGTITWFTDGKLPEAGNIIGRPLLDAEIRIVDLHDRDVAPGEVGEIVLRSPSVMTEYYKDAKNTADTLRNGWLHTGDVGRLGEDGNYYFVDRLKDMIKTGGENVSCLEVEDVLNTHPDVLVSAVFGVPHPYWVEGVTAVIVPKAEGLTEAALLEYARSRMAGYKIPKKFILIKGHELPVSPTGKILKRELRKMYQDVFKDVKGK